MTPPSRSHPSSTTGPLFRGAFLLGFLYNFIISLHFTNNALYPLYVVHEGGGVDTVGMFMGVYAVAAVLGRPLVGMLIDRRGPGFVLVLGSLSLSLPALGYLAMLGEGMLPPVWVLRVVQGVGYGAHFSATFTLAAAIAPPHRRTEAVAMYGVSGLIGAMLGPALGEVLVSGAGLAWFFSTMAAIGVCAALVISRVRLEPPAAAAFPSPRSVLAALREPRLMTALLLAFLLAMAFSSPTAFLATLAYERGIESFSLFFTAWGMAGIAIRFLGGSWGDRVGVRRVLLPGFLLYAAGLVLVHIATHVPVLVGAGLLCGAAHGISFPAVTSLGYSLAPSRITGSIMAVVTGMMDAGGAVTALAVGALAGQVGMVVVFPIAAASAVIGAAVLAVDIRRDPRRIRRLPEQS